MKSAARSDNGKSPGDSMAFPFLALIHPDDGLVGNQEEKNMAELDAWYLLGVNKFVNNIDIRH